MKRNLVPLLGIAFVVAVASTGIFYGLFVGKLKSTTTPPPKNSVVTAARPLTPGTVLTEEHLAVAPWPNEAVPKGIVTSKEEVLGRAVLQNVESGEPLLLTKVVSVNPAADGEGVPTGLRAVSVHVADSSGIVKLLQPGHKVDVQVVSFKDDHNRLAEARTILEEVTVMAVATQPESTSTGHLTAPVVTLLVKPRDAESLAAADSAARVRLTLRNPIDNGRIGGAAPVVPSAVPSTAPAGNPARPAITSTTPGTGPKVALSIRFAGASSNAWKELGGALSEPHQSGAMQVSSFRQGREAEQAITMLQDRKLLDVLSETQLEARPNRVVSVRHGAQKDGEAECGLRIRFVPYLTASGRIRLRVLPEVTSASPGARGFQSAETDVELVDGRPFVVSGLVRGEEQSQLLDRLFPGKAVGRDLVVMVSPRVIAQSN